MNYFDLDFDLDFVDPVSACGQTPGYTLSLGNSDGFSTTVYKPRYSHPTCSWPKEYFRCCDTTLLIFPCLFHSVPTIGIVVMPRQTFSVYKAHLPG